MAVGECKFCGSKAPLIRSHIIPEGLYDKPDGSQEALKIFSTDNPERAIKSWTGIYDRDLVCHACEKRWDSWDSYGIEFLRNIEQRTVPVLSDGKQIGYQADDYDYDRLKLFFLSVAWRCGASERREFSLVKLGPYLNKLRHVLTNSDPDCIPEFEVSLCRFDDKELGTAMLNPHCERFDGINYVRIYMYGFTVSIKMDRRPSMGPFNHLKLVRGEPLRIPLRKFKGGPEHRLLQKMVRNVPG
jgi:hypothetical protein